MTGKTKKELEVKNDRLRANLRAAEDVIEKATRCIADTRVARDAEWLRAELAIRAAFDPSRN